MTTLRDIFEAAKGKNTSQVIRELYPQWLGLLHNVAQSTLILAKVADRLDEIESSVFEIAARRDAWRFEKRQLAALSLLADAIADQEGSVAVGAPSVAVLAALHSMHAILIGKKDNEL